MFVPLSKFSHLLTDNLYKVVDALREYDYEVRIVGGAVRDLLLGKEPRDVDLATTALPDEIMYLLEKNDLKYTTKGIVHGTVKVIFPHDEEYEITTRDYAIQDNGTGQNLEIEHDPDWKADAIRRDFTVNSLMMDLGGEIHDYVGGLDDLRTRTVRMHGDASKRIQNNPNLIVRFFKILGYFQDPKVNRETAEAVKTNISLVNDIDTEWMDKQFKTLKKYPNGERSLAIFDKWCEPVEEKEEITEARVPYQGKREKLPHSDTPEPKYIRFGMWPKNERSTQGQAVNWMDMGNVGRRLAGVSVFPVRYDPNKNRWMFISDDLADSGYASLDELLSQASEHRRPMYLVTGEEVKNDEGTDGEPLLRKLRILDTLSMLDVEHEGYYEPEEDAPHHPGGNFSKFTYGDFWASLDGKELYHTNDPRDVELGKQSGLDVRLAGRKPVKESAYAPVKGRSGDFENGQWVQDHDELVVKALLRWRGSPTDARIHIDDIKRGEPPPPAGSGKKMRAEAEALLWELKHKAQPNPVPLYRGARSFGKGGLTSWSESKKVAQTFAKGGQVQKAEPNTLMGLRMQDYLLHDTTEEKEWIIIPSELRESADQWGNRDDKGNLIVYYHGTNAKFDPNHFKTPAMFTTKRDYAANLGKVIAVNLNIQNPADLRALHMSPSHFGMNEVNALKNEGYDGAQYRGEAWIAFYPNQIRPIQIREKLDVPTPSRTNLTKKYDWSPEEAARKFKQGIDVEKEHTTDRDQAEEIARDHLGEKPDYYDLLKKVEESESSGFKVKEVAVGMITAEGDTVCLVGGRRNGSSPEGTMRLYYDIYLTADLIKKKHQKVGFVELYNRDGSLFDPVGLINIELNNKARGEGIGKAVVNAILATVKHDLRIDDIQRPAIGFWTKMGAVLPDGSPLKPNVNKQKAVIRYN